MNNEVMAQEAALLERMHQDEGLSKQLYVVREEELVPGLPLLYPLQGPDHTKRDYGCHILRSAASGYQYLPDSDLRGGIRAGLFYTLPKELWQIPVPSDKD